jgi:hypothetical protein
LLDNVSDVLYYFPCFLLVSGVLEHFFGQRPSLPIGCRILQIICQLQAKIADTALLTQTEVIAANHSAFIIG